ncbi:hypothetical protein [uncultured Desulfovibrio sp.]|uniref:hypothetical protein n=1 Tax=uncultured Desulfovibrio sp. TaxID=167968 RepID=UPI00266D5DF4|nr:hypothetical protein [uncultured Desulfovibrio sp.]
MTEPTDPIVELLDAARALHVLALGLTGEAGDPGAALPQGDRAGLAYLLHLLSNQVDGCAQRLDDQR